ncbi:MAG TPA: hypothetical protein VFD45_01210 [Patescibacteria group bacterium]|nr:hypothetical protein [Patescibacteria group bacterium]
MNLQETLRIYDWKREEDFSRGFHSDATRAAYYLIQERQILQELNGKKKNEKDLLLQAEQNVTFIRGLSGMVRNFFTNPSNFKDRTIEIARNGDSFISYGNHGLHKAQSYGLFYFKNSLSEPHGVIDQLLSALWNGDPEGKFEQDKKLVKKLGSCSKVKLLDRFIGTIRPYARSKR